ncbi:Arm DNA-binding domain-containing protein [Romeriopsis navalis]|nr:DUF3596 domain-containing protein [Romeriopsis navalis]
MGQAKQRVKVENDRGNLRLRWSYAGNRKTLYLKMYDTALARKVAEAKANQIEADLITGNYDPTLAKYCGASPSRNTTIDPVMLFQRFYEYRTHLRSMC